MAKVEVKLTGLKAMVALLVILGVLGFRWQSARASLGVEGREVIQSWIGAELLRDRLSKFEEPDETSAAELLAAAGVEVESLSAMGPLDDTVVRVELSAQSLPVGEDNVRYYRMEYSSVAGWRHRGPSNALRYYLAAF